MPEYRSPDVGEALLACEDCGSGTFDQQVHTQWHADIADALLEHRQLKEELARADLAAAGLTERGSAAVRLAEAARDLRAAEFAARDRREPYKEFVAALELWERVREGQTVREESAERTAQAAQAFLRSAQAEGSVQEDITAEMRDAVEGWEHDR